LTPARSATPSHQRRTSHDQLASVDEQPRSQIRGINAITESFFATLECELLDRSRFATHAQARTAVIDFIEGFYNPRRRHSTLGYLSPAEFERRHTTGYSAA
jgi:transposase InsO family protein